MDIIVKKFEPSLGIWKGSSRRAWLSRRPKRSIFLPVWRFSAGSLLPALRSIRRAARSSPHPASQQRGPVQPHLQCELCRKSGLRGHRIGETLVRHCMETARDLGFRVLQFNAVVRTNTPALALYRRLGFVQLSVISQEKDSR